MESINEYFDTELDIHILAKATDKEYKKGYERFLSRYHGNSFYWEHEGNFKDQVMEIVDRFVHPWTLCFLDDDVFVEHVNVAPFLKHITDDTNALSLRMGTHLIYCYPKDRPMEQPQFSTVDSCIIKWNWSNCEYDWGYPMSLGGNIYRAQWLKDFWHMLPFTAPNYIEGLMAMNPPWIRPCQISFTKQRLYNVANNLVQDVCDNRFEFDAWNMPSSLNGMYLSGQKIDLSKIAGKLYDSANGPAEYRMVKQ
jgi:hypothetical protein